MDKNKLIAHIRSELEKELAVLKESERATREAATHEESKPENEYDTRALEASYLAGAQSKRITETEELLTIFKHLKPKSFTKDDPISATALVETKLNGKFNYFFMMSKGGGTQVTFEQKRIQVLTPSSPLGEALLGLKLGDSALLEQGNKVLEYEIVTVE